MKNNLFLFTFILATFFTLPAGAATKLDFATVDQLTYRCYMEKKWDSVILVGKQAIRQNIDFYYLRARMGIAFYEKEDYFPAVTHLQKARQFNADDPVIANYLYYSYLYTNRVEEAGLLKPDINKGMRPSEVHAEGGYTISSDRAPDNLATLMGSDSIYGEQDLYGNNYYGNLALKMKISNRIGLSLSYNYLNFTKTKYIQYGRGEQHLESVKDTVWDPIYSGQIYNYSYPWVVYDTSFTYQVKQQEFYAGVTLAPGAGFRIMPAFHFLHVAYTATNPSYRFDTVQYPSYYTTYDDSLYTTPDTLLAYSFPQQDTSFNNYVAALAVTKYFGLFNIGLSGSWSNLNGKTQKQLGISLTYFPLGNLNFYGTTTATGFFQKNAKRLLLSQVLGVKITPWMWGEANFYYGDYTNANIFNGSIVYNNSDIIDYRGGATLLFLAGKHLQFSLIYQYSRKESQQVYYIKTQSSGSNEINEIQKTKNNPYNTNTLIGGITWKL
jgi:hypothetical protein